MSDDFYIGYRKEAPPALAQFIRGLTVAIVISVIAVAVLAATIQQPAGDGTYDFGGATKFEADVVTDPIPLAILNSEDGKPVTKTAVALVGTGKHGAPDDLRAADGKRVTFTGANESRGGIRMVEVGSNSGTGVAGAAEKHTWHGLISRNQTFEGELIDTKCYLGVMNPAEGKVHRGCAALCLRGGVPPGLLLRDSQGRAVAVFLAAKPGAINPNWAGRIVVVNGAIQTIGGIPILQVESISLR